MKAITLAVIFSGLISYGAVSGAPSDTSTTVPATYEAPPAPPDPDDDEDFHKVKSPRASRTMRSQ